MVAREMLALAVEAERPTYLNAHAETLNPTGRHGDGNGLARPHAIITGSGLVS
jgi:hypothetical protein